MVPRVVFLGGVYCCYFFGLFFVNFILNFSIFELCIGRLRRLGAVCYYYYFNCFCLVVFLRDSLR